MRFEVASRNPASYPAAMKRTSFDGMNCSLARTLDIVGEWWSLLIVREAIWGTTRFDDFQRTLGIARNILTTRLNTLESHGILTKTPVQGQTRAHEYLLTDKGRALLPALVALVEWGDAWVHKDIGPPIRFFDTSTGQPTQPMAVRDAAGRALTRDQVEIRPGPGADLATIRHAARQSAKHRDDG
jgi:DNA-binding HxlR family transcriptional regulator